MSRYLAILEYFFDVGDTYYLLTTDYSDSIRPPKRSPSMLRLDSQAICWKSFVSPDSFEGEADPIYWHTFVSIRRWGESRLDDVLRRVASNDISNVLIAPSRLSSLVHPYDGGIDVIAESSVQRDALRAKFGAWAPSTLEGL
jgi:hypothetical protein